MHYIATIFLSLMTVALVVCGVLLWRRRNEPNDYSRTIQAVFSWVSAFFALTFILRTWAETTTADSALFEPEHIFAPILFQMAFFLYPLEVIRPSISRVKVYALLFLPLLLLVFVGMYAGIKYTTIHSYAELWQHIGEFNVWFRLLALAVISLYCFSLFLVPYDWRQSSADRKFILCYALGFCLIGVLHISIQVSHSYWLVLAHQVVWITFFIAVAWYELRERLLVPLSEVEPQDGKSYDAINDTLWRQTLILLDCNDKWRSPDLSLSSLSEQLGSNRTYVSEAFKRNVGTTFIDYITRRRIDYVVEQLRQNPNANIQKLFNYVGYRQRSTAWRNFHKIMSITPTEFVDSLKQ